MTIFWNAINDVELIDNNLYLINFVQKLVNKREVVADMDQFHVAHWDEGNEAFYCDYFSDDGCCPGIYDQGFIDLELVDYVCLINVPPKRKRK